MLIINILVLGAVGPEYHLSFLAKSGRVIWSQGCCAGILDLGLKACLWGLVAG